MRTRIPAGVLAAVGIALSTTGAWAQRANEPARAALIDALMFGAERRIDWGAYPADVGAEGRKYQQRFQSYQSAGQPDAARRGPETLETIVAATWLRYAHKLAAVSDDPRARALATEFVERLKPCYEWEGYHDCPEREARFAEGYQAANPNGPFRDYLPLLAAHRWLCTAEAYEYEERPADARRSRQQFEAAMTTARRSASLLVRTAADELRARATVSRRSGEDAHPREHRR